MIYLHICNKKLSSEILLKKLDSAVGLNVYHKRCGVVRGVIFKTS